MYFHVIITRFGVQKKKTTQGNLFTYLTYIVISVECRIVHRNSKYEIWNLAISNSDKSKLWISRSKIVVRCTLTVEHSYQL